jgi:hypothetical protein
VSWDAPNILVAVIASVIGLAYFVYGKKRTAMNFLISGIGLMAYSYVAPSLVWNIVIGIVLAAVPFTVWR